LLGFTPSPPSQRARLFPLLDFTPSPPPPPRRCRKRRCSTSTCSAPTRAATRSLFVSPSAAGSPPSSSSTRSSPSTRHGAKVSVHSPHYPAPAPLPQTSSRSRSVSDSQWFSSLLQGSSSWTRSGRSSTLPARRLASSKPYVLSRIAMHSSSLFLLGVLGFM
jgi:hypothetical protein